MSALMIKDLSVTEQLDDKAMKAVRGGFDGFGYFPYFPSLSFNLDNSKKVDAQQLIQQEMNVNNYSDNNNAFAKSLSTKITPTMTANNMIEVH